jgi:REP element-mobilizing transposase RayT
MARGIEHRRIFRTDADREDFVERLGALASAGFVTVYAWVLLPNHLHLLLRSGTRPLARIMRSLLTGYAGTFNRRHRRKGHLFQNRYKSIVVEEEPYFLELVRYLHLNPLRAGIVPDLDALAHYPWSGHTVLLGQSSVRWQDTRQVLGRFSARPGPAREAYRAFVVDGAGQGRRPEFQGGGLVRSAGGWHAVAALRRGRERWLADERILGSGTFVGAVLEETIPPPSPAKAPAAPEQITRVLTRCAAAWGVSLGEMTGRSRRRVVAHARSGAAWLLVQGLGLPINRAAQLLNISPTIVRDGMLRAEMLAEARGLDLFDMVEAGKQ